MKTQPTVNSSIIKSLNSFIGSSNQKNRLWEMFTTRKKKKTNHNYDNAPYDGF